MRKLLFWTVIYPGSIALSCTVLLGGLALCQSLYPGMALPKAMLAVLWLPTAMLLCAGVQTLARRWEV